VVALAHQHDLNAENALRTQVGRFRQENAQKKTAEIRGSLR